MKKRYALLLMLSLLFNFYVSAYYIKEKTIPELNGHYFIADNSYGKEHKQLNFYFYKKSNQFKLVMYDSDGQNERILIGEFKQLKNNIYQLNFEDGSTHSIELKFNNMFFIDYQNGMYLMAGNSWNFNTGNQNSE